MNRQYRNGCLIGAAAGAVFAVSSQTRAGEFALDAYGVGVAIGGALVGGLIGLIVGAFVPAKPGREERPYASNPEASSEWREESSNNRPGNYLARHWRGALSLPISYWLSGIVGALLLTVFAAAVSFIDVTVYPKAAALGAISVWLVLLMAQIWWGVGVWRSAGRYAGKPFWAMLAKVMTVLGFIGLGLTLFHQGVPQVAELAGIIGESGPSKYGLRLMPNGIEVEVSGQYELGLSRDLLELLASHPNIHTVRVNSNGGRMVEADKLAGIIVDRELSTVVSAICFSACVNVFAAGKDRLITEGAKIGLHSADFPGITPEERAELNRVTEEFLLSRGIDPAFIKKGLNTPPQAIWFPTHQELLSSGLATSIVAEELGVDA